MQSNKSKIKWEVQKISKQARVFPAQFCAKAYMHKNHKHYGIYCSKKFLPLAKTIIGLATYCVRHDCVCTQDHSSALY